MNKIDWKATCDRVSLMLKKHSPEILTGIGISGMITTTVLAVRATPEALRRIEEKKKAEHHRKLTAMQTVQAAGRCYIPSAITGTISVGCLIGASAVNGRRNAALATAYSLAETSLRDYRAKVIETIGERKETGILEALDRERVEKNPPTASDVAYVEGSGQTLCYDAMFGRYFYSDIETLNRAVNKLNRQMSTMSEPYISLNEFYMEVNLPTVEIGDSLGWNVDKGMIELRFSSQLAGGRTPCLVMSYAVAPEYDYF